jgi:multidrug transporter EmrE-like cation transporter
VLGPLALSVVTGRRASSWLWAALALGGVVLLGRGDVDGLDPIGVVFAVGAAAMWAAYILLSVRTGARFPKADGLALAMTVAAALTVPWGAAVSGSALLDPGTLGLGATVAVLSSVLPYTLELLALRRMPTSTFAVLMSLGPAVAALAGYVVLDQALAPSQLVAVGLVIGASAGAVHTSNNGSQRSGLLGGGEREAGNGQQPEGAREVEVVEDAGAQVRDEGSGEEEDQPDGGGDPEVAQTAMSRTTPDIPRRPPPSAWRAAAATMVAHPSPRSCPGRIPLGPGRLQRPQHWPRL